MADYVQFENHHNGSEGTEFCHELPKAPRGTLIAFSVIGAVIIAINTIGLVVVFSSKRLRASGNGLLMANMIVSDLLQGLHDVIYANPVMVEILHHVAPLCSASMLFSNAIITSSFSTIAAMSFDRYLAVTFHMRYSYAIDIPRRYGLGLLTLWSWVLLANSAPMWFGARLCVKRGGGCAYQNGGPSIYILLGGVYMPAVLTIIFSYIKIWRVMHHLRQRENCTSYSGVRLSASVMTSCLVLGIFIFSTFPTLVFALTGGIGGSFWSDFTALTLLLQSLLNPLAYGLTNKEFKQSLLKGFGLRSTVHPWGMDTSISTSKAVSKA